MAFNFKWFLKVFRLAWEKIQAGRCHFLWLISETNFNMEDSKNFQKGCRELIKQCTILDIFCLSIRERCTWSISFSGTIKKFTATLQVNVERQWFLHWLTFATLSNSCHIAILMHFCIHNVQFVLLPNQCHLKKIVLNGS